MQIFLVNREKGYFTPTTHGKESVKTRFHYWKQLPLLEIILPFTTMLVKLKLVKNEKYQTVSLLKIFPSILLFCSPAKKTKTEKINQLNY